MAASPQPKVSRLTRSGHSRMCELLAWALASVNRASTWLLTGIIYLRGCPEWDMPKSPLGETGSGRAVGGHRTLDNEPCFFCRCNAHRPRVRTLNTSAAQRRKWGVEVHGLPDWSRAA